MDFEVKWKHDAAMTNPIKILMIAASLLGMNGYIAQAPAEPVTMQYPITTSFGRRV